mgnify:CR=1 FL=1
MTSHEKMRKGWILVMKKDCQVVVFNIHQAKLKDGIGQMQRLFSSINSLIKFWLTLLVPWLRFSHGHQFLIPSHKQALNTMWIDVKSNEAKILWQPTSLAYCRLSNNFITSTRTDSINNKEVFSVHFFM